jgi:hypothetical protein
MRNARLEEVGIRLVLGQTYHLHGEVSANTNAQIEVGIVPGTGGLSGATIQTVAVTPNWTPIDMDFTADGIGMNDITVVFYLGGSSTLYRFGGVTLQEGSGDTTALPPTPKMPVAVANRPADGGWGIELNGQASAGAIQSAEGPIIDVDRPDADPADVQFAREDVDVTNGASYVLHFRARSGTSRIVPVEAQDMSPDHPNIGLSTQAQLTPEWQDFDLTFAAQNVRTGKARVALVLGAQAGTIQLAEIAFSSASTGQPVAAKVAAASGVALVPVSSWDLDTEGETDAVVQPSPTGAVVEIDRADGAPAHITLKQDGVALDDGKIYDLEFKAKASVARQIPVIAQVDSGSIRLVGLQGSVQVTPVWQEYDLRFTAVQPIPAHSRIAFLLGGASGTVELSDVSLLPYTDPGPKVTASIQGE